jgi:hypothetical protein
MSGGRVVTVSAEQSQISTDKTVLAADGVDVCTVSVTVQQDRNDENGQALPTQRYAASNVTISVTPSTGVVITQPTGTADAGGTVTATFTSTNAASVTIGATAFGRTLVSGGAVTVVGGAAPVDPPSGDPFYTMGTTEATVFENANGFTWSARSAQVTVVAAPSGRSGFCAAHTYAGTAPGGNGNAEQRFNLGRNVSELWVEYDIYVPANFVHRNDNPNNNKFFTVWNTSYGSGSGTWQPLFEFRRITDTSSSIRPMSTTEYDLSISSNVPPNRTGPSGSFTNPDLNKAFIGGSGPVDIAGWSQVRIHVKASSATTENDGVIEMWIDGVLFARATGAFRNFGDTGDTVLRNGYFWGAANSGYAEQTTFYTYGAKFYDTDPGWT